MNKCFTTLGYKVFDVMQVFVRSLKLIEVKDLIRTEFGRG